MDTRKAKSKETRNKNVGMITHSIQSPYIFLFIIHVRGKISLYIIIFVHIITLRSFGDICCLCAACFHQSSPVSGPVHRTPHRC